jgi:nitroreductase
LSEKPDAGRLEIESIHQFSRQAPALVVILSSPVLGSKIPRVEQEMAAGAAAMNLLHATHASGFAGCWLTGWPSYNSKVRDAFGGPDDMIVGFMFLGTPSGPLEERPRPDYDTVVSHWDGA